jgi:two-component system, OmpR family, response regulator VicR
MLKPGKPLTIGTYEFDYKNLSLSTEGYSETLTQKEADLLKLLNEHRNQVIKRSFILETIWGKDDYFLGRSLDVFISRLRKYLGLDERIKVENIHGVGFKFRVDD